RLFFSNSLTFLHISSDSVYLSRPVPSRKFLLGPSEIADVIVNFADSPSQSVILLNDASYPFPTGDQPDEFSGKVMKFIIYPGSNNHQDPSHVPKRLLPPPPPPTPDHRAAATR
ncbi:multicopper oxidase LPR1-like, partial [Dendrobium catenatum]|uniref:multicopper oxidase LPR1-like n=1 Tax=Dendrobium catenatum TaxID=906689 RepID=UPI0010A03DB2